MVAEHRSYGHDFRMHVADPYEAVPLDAVPEIVLHVEVDGVGSGFPDLVDPFIVTLE